MDREKVKQEVISIISKVLNSQISVEDMRQDVAAWDSLKHISIIFSLEDAFGVEFSEEEFAEIKGVSDLIERVVKKCAIN